MTGGARLAATAVTIAIASAAVDACSAFDDGPTPETPALDGGEDSAADVAIDVTTDAPGAPDAGCAPDAHTFCDDFDDGPLGARWTSRSVGAPVSLELASDAGAFSAPNALVAALAPNDGGYFNGYFMQVFDRPAKSISCRAMMFVEDHSSSANPSILGIKYRFAEGALDATEALLSMDAVSTSLAVTQTMADSGTDSYPRAELSIPLSKWVETKLTIDESGNVAVSVDGAVYVSGKLPIAPRPNLGFELRLGLFAIGDSDPIRVRYDDVFCDVVEDL